MTTVQIETVRTESFSMDFFRFGHGKETLVILPGLSVQSVMVFADAVTEAYQRLANDFTIYVFDYRKEMPIAYPMHEMAQDTAGAIRALGLNRVCVFGASLGGMIAMRLAIEQPELIHKLVLGSTSACIEGAQYQAVETWIQMAKSGNKADLYLAFGEAIYPRDVFEQSREFLLEAAKCVTDEDLDRFVILAESMKGFDITKDLGKIACPILAIGSKDDQILGADATLRIAERLNRRRDFSLYMYDGYGHASYDTAPDYKDRILRFLIQEANV